MKIWYFVLILSLTLNLSAAASARPRPPQHSERVKIYLIEASAAWACLDEHSLADMEEALSRGFFEIEAMVDSYTPNHKPNRFLKDRGWGQLVWTQIVFRLIAIRNGIYDQELRFAERVALEGVARHTLNLVETSVRRLYKLLEAKDAFGFDDQIDPFAQNMFATDDATIDYKGIISDFEEHFMRRKQAVIARLESGKRPGIVDPADIPRGTRYAAIYEQHRNRLDDEDRRLDEVLLSLVRYDPHRVRELVETVQTAHSADARQDAANELKLHLLVLENVLEASEKDPAVHRMIQYYERLGYLAFNPHEGYPDIFQDLMVLLHRAKRRLDTQTQPAALRDLYAVGELIQ